MKIQRQVAAVFLVVFLLIAVPLGRNLGVKAEPPSPNSGQTAVGSAVQIRDLQVRSERPPAEANNLTFMPMVSGVEGTPISGGEEPSTEAQKVVKLVNDERAKVGCGPLQIDAQLTTAAQAHSEDMAMNDFFSHTGADESTPWERIRGTGYDYWTAAENIAAGYITPESVVAGWMDSEYHRINIVDCYLEDIGVGYYYLANDTGDLNYYYYWTQDFGARK